MTINIEKLNCKIWEKETKKRYYIQSHYCMKSNAYFTEDKNDKNRAKYVYEYENGILCANKCYNGAVKQELENSL